MQAIALGSVLLGLVLAVGSFTSYQKSHEPAQLSSTKLDSKDVHDIATLLMQHHIEHKVGPNEDEILVDPKDRSQARLLMLQARLPHRGTRPALDNGSNPFSGSSGQERAKRHHALEADLAQTLSQFQGVTEVNVNIAVPEDQNVFEPIPTTASVTLHLEEGRQLDPDQVSAIANFVAASVPQLAPNKVTVLDAGTGHELTNDQSPEAQKIQAARKTGALEHEKADSLRKQAQTQLDEILGPHHSYVAVTVEFETAEQETKSHIPGTLSDAIVSQSEDIEKWSSHTSEEDGKNYERKKSIIKHDPSIIDEHKVVREPRLKKISASVAFDNIPPARVEELKNLVSGAMGIEEDGRDQIKTSNVPFNHAIPVTAGHAPPAALPTTSSDLSALAMAMGAGFLLIMPAFLMWVNGRSRRTLTQSFNKTMQPTATSTDLSDLVQDKRGTRAAQETKLNPQSTLMDAMQPKDMAHELRSQWLGGK